MSDRRHCSSGIDRASADAAPPVWSEAASGPCNPVYEPARGGWRPAVVRLVTIIEGDPTHRRKYRAPSQDIHPHL